MPNRNVLSSSNNTVIFCWPNGPWPGCIAKISGSGYFSILRLPVQYRSIFFPFIPEFSCFDRFPVIKHDTIAVNELLKCRCQDVLFRHRLGRRPDHRMAEPSHFQDRHGRECQPETRGCEDGPPRRVSGSYSGWRFRYASEM